jgi:protein-S-isoprenylcysteine O-methyltransferase Ste14
MEGEDLKNKSKTPGVIHLTLAYSYFVFFFVAVIGILLDCFFPVRIFEKNLMAGIGFVFLVLATILIFWAQNTSRALLGKGKEDVTKEHFCRGPYCYTRTPTHWGLLFLILGFGFVANAFFVIMLTIVSFLLSKITFIKKQEMLLEEKFGAPYIEYKKSVKL